MRCVSAYSTEKDTSAALDEVLSSLTGDPGAASPDLAVVHLSRHHRDNAEAVAQRLNSTITPDRLIGTVGAGIIVDDREIEHSPALSVVTMELPGVQIEPFRVTVESDEDRWRLVGFPFERIAQIENPSVMILGDPYSFPMDLLLKLTNEQIPGVPLFGGLSSGAQEPDGNRLLLGDSVFSDGAVGITLSGDLELKTVVSQGCRPVGRHLVVTKAKQNVIEQLGGVPAAQALHELIKTLSAGDSDLLKHALHVGLALDEYKSEFKRGDFLVRSVVDIDQHSGSIMINEAVRAGQTIQFHVRDPDTAGQDLEFLLTEEASFFNENRPEAVLLFSCNGRGTHMFDVADHDVSCVRKSLGDIPVTGFFAAGEIGPVAGQNFLHGFTASMAVLCHRAHRGIDT